MDSQKFLLKISSKLMQMYYVYFFNKTCTVTSRQVYSTKGVEKHNIIIEIL